MRDDLLEAYAAIDWAESELPAFDMRLRRWLDNNIEIMVEENPPPATYDSVVAFEKAELPLVFSIEAGAYINAIRSGLDILACVVGKREIVLDPDDIYFPVANSFEDFLAGNYKGSKFVRKLPADSGNIIKQFKPYKGGNDTLWALHHLDITRKHKRLLSAYVRPAATIVTGFGLTDIWKHIATGWVDAGNGKTVIGLLLKGANCPKIQHSAHICFNETASFMAGTPVVRSIRGFVQTARAIITAFDNP